jgi:hypothetical protein
MRIDAFERRGSIDLRVRTIAESIRWSNDPLFITISIGRIAASQRIPLGLDR